jgi:hypothetical protein
MGPGSSRFALGRDDNGVSDAVDFAYPANILTLFDK